MSRRTASRTAPASEHLWLDGALLAAPHARLDARDRGLLYGEALFETLRCYSGRPFALDRHLARLRAGARTLGWPLRLPHARAASAICDVLGANGLGDSDAAVRLTVTGGIDGPLGFEGPPATAGSVLVRARPVERLRGPRTVRLALADPALSRSLPALKTTGYVAARLARRFARDRGSDDALLMGGSGEVLEGTTANVLIRLGRRLVTPPTDGRILPGVTRALVLELARARGIAVEERTVHHRELEGAREVLLVGSVAEIVIATAIEDRPVGDGAPGPWGRALWRAYRGLAVAQTQHLRPPGARRLVQRGSTGSQRLATPSNRDWAKRR